MYEGLNGLLEKIHQKHPFVVGAYGDEGNNPAIEVLGLDLTGFRKPVRSGR
jgi:hypothetical protein